VRANDAGWCLVACFVVSSVEPWSASRKLDVTGYCYEVRRTKRPAHSGHFLICCLSHLSSNHSLCIHYSSSGKNKQTHLVRSREKLGGKCPLILPAKYLRHTPKGHLTCCKTLQHGTDSFTSPPKESVLRIFITFNNSSCSAGCKPANLGSNSKYDNH
jgi:hypothetical protein